MKWERWYLWQIVRQKRTVQATETTLHGKEIYLTECCIIFRFFTVFCPMEWPSAVKSRNISFSVHLRWQFHLGYSNFLPLLEENRDIKSIIRVPLQIQVTFVVTDKIDTFQWIFLETCNWRCLLKFMYSEKATKFCKISNLLLTGKT